MESYDNYGKIIDYKDNISYKVDNPNTLSNVNFKLSNSGIN